MIWGSLGSWQFTLRLSVMPMMSTSGAEQLASLTPQPSEPHELFGPGHVRQNGNRLSFTQVACGFSETCETITPTRAVCQSGRRRVWSVTLERRSGPRTQRRRVSWRQSAIWKVGLRVVGIGTCKISFMAYKACRTEKGCLTCDLPGFACAERGEGA